MNRTDSLHILLLKYRFDAYHCYAHWPQQHAAEATCCYSLLRQSLLTESQMDWRWDEEIT